MRLNGTYAGFVENVNDPEKLGRVKVRVPHVHGVQGGATGYIATNDLPWALPAGLPAGESSSSGGFSQLPVIGDRMWVRFLDAEPEKPIWEWAMQTSPGAKKFGLHKYTEQGRPEQRTAWTRYSHTIELNAGGIIATTGQGYRAVFSDGDAGANNGLIQITTALGNLLEFDDDSKAVTLNVVEDLYLNVSDEIIVQARSVELDTADSVALTVGTDFDLQALSSITLRSGTVTEIEAEGNLSILSGITASLEADTSLVLDAPLVTIGNGSQPFVQGISLQTFLTNLLVYLSTHTHTSSSPGSPTSPPIVPPAPLTSILSTKILGE